MRLLDYVKQIFSSGESVNEETTSINKDSQDFESYYVPPAEDMFQENNTSEETITQEEDYYLHTPGSIAVDHLKNNESESVYYSHPEANIDLSETAHQIKNNEKLHHFQDNVISVIEEFDSYLNRIEDDDAKELISLFQHRLIESLAKSGLERIDSDSVFSCLKHTPIPFQIIPDGKALKEIKRAGLLRNGEIVLKALVTVNI